MRQQTFEKALTTIRSDAQQAMDKIVALAGLDGGPAPTKEDAEQAFILLSETLQRIEQTANEALK